MERTLHEAISAHNQCQSDWANTALERLPYTWDQVIDKEPLKIKEVQHAGIEKAEQLF